MEEETKHSPESSKKKSFEENNEEEEQIIVSKPTTLESLEEKTTVKENEINEDNENKNDGDDIPIVNVILDNNVKEGEAVVDIEKENENVKAEEVVEGSSKNTKEIEKISTIPTTTNQQHPSHNPHHLHPHQPPISLLPPSYISSIHCSEEEATEFIVLEETDENLTVEGGMPEDYYPSTESESSTFSHAGSLLNNYGNDDDKSSIINVIGGDGDGKNGNNYPNPNHNNPNTPTPTENVSAIVEIIPREQEEHKKESEKEYYHHDNRLRTVSSPNVELERNSIALDNGNGEMEKNVEKENVEKENEKEKEVNEEVKEEEIIINMKKNIQVCNSCYSTKNAETSNPMPVKTLSTKELLHETEITDSSELCSESDEITIAEFNSEYFKRLTLEEKLKEYSLEERKYLIIDWNNFAIIDTREDSQIKAFVKKSEKKMVSVGGGSGSSGSGSRSKESSELDLKMTGNKKGSEKKSSAAESTKNSKMKSEQKCEESGLESKSCKYESKSNQYSELSEEEQQIKQQQSLSCSLSGNLSNPPSHTRTNYMSLAGPTSSNSPKPIWNEHWQQSHKTHEAFLSSICKNNFPLFNQYLDKRQNLFPIEINYRSESNWAPIHYAAMHASAAIMSRLINHPRIDVNILTDFGMTALHIATQSNKLDNCELLLHAGVCVDYKDNEGSTALHYAVELGYKDIVKLLLDVGGASQWIRNVRGDTPRDLCTYQGLLELFSKGNISDLEEGIEKDNNLKDSELGKESEQDNNKDDDHDSFFNNPVMFSRFNNKRNNFVDRIINGVNGVNGGSIVGNNEQSSSTANTTNTPYHKDNKIITNNNNNNNDDDDDDSKKNDKNLLDDLLSPFRKKKNNNGDVIPTKPAAKNPLLANIREAVGIVDEKEKEREKERERQKEKEKEKEKLLEKQKEKEKAIITSTKGKASETRKKNIYKMYQLIVNTKSEPVTLASFKFYKKIGQGAFGEVYVVKKVSSSNPSMVGNKMFALKAVEKERVIGTALYRYIQTEKEVLSQISHPFIVKLSYAFQTEAYLFLVMDYCEGGDMSRLLEKKQRLEEHIVKMYAAEILLGLEALHQNMIIYRDLKPENIVLDKDGHACITDFGLSKKTIDLDVVNRSFCGTPAYLPLEIINRKGHTRMADWYEFGVVLYELMTGIPPFYADTKSELYDKVRAGVIRFPKNSSDKFRDLIKKLLAQNPEKRLGFENDAESIKQHPWFEGIDWEMAAERKLPVPPLETKIKIPSEPMNTKYADIKSEKYFIPSWSFIM